MRQLLYQTLSQLQVPRALSAANRRRITILVYHGFTDKTHAGIENHLGLHQHVGMFRRQLEHLREQFTVVPLQAVVDHYLHGAPLPPYPAVVTIDDGYLSNYTLAYPLLRELGVPATIFVTTEFVDAKRYHWADRVTYAIDHAPLQALAELLQKDAPADDPRALRVRALLHIHSRLKSIPQDQRAAQVEEIEAACGNSLTSAKEVPPIYLPLAWTDVREMMDSGLVSIGSHTDAHFILSRCTPEVVRADLRTAKRIIEERTGAPCPLFCYPNGTRGDFDARTRAIVQEVGHTCALTSLVGFNDARADRYELRRVGVLDGQSFEDFVMTVAGLVPLLTRVGDGLRRAGLRN